jgi:CRP-like cAMP-binding protein
MKLVGAILLNLQSSVPEFQNSSDQRVISTRKTTAAEESIDTETPDLVPPKLVPRNCRRLEEDLMLNYELFPGEEFGQDSLIDDRPRAYTAVAVEPTELIKIKRSDFKMIMQGKKDNTVNQFASVFDECLLFRGICSETKLKLAKRSYLKKYRPNTVIMRQGDRPMELF